jgi:hypothetical protein
VTDVSDAAVAQELGINHAPKLANVGASAPRCQQEVKTSDPLLGRAPVEFEGAPDFSPTRSVTPATPAPFPPAAFTVGAQAGAGYSPYVAVDGSTVVFNAPIVATGDGPFDVTTHTNTHDRTLGIDTENMTTDHLFVRGFANGRSIAYLSFDSSDAFTATVERSTFVPALTDLAFANGDGRSDSARAAIFTFVNAKTGLEPATERGASQGPGRAQGLTHALSLPIVGKDAAVANADVLEALKQGADVSNVFDAFPTNGSSEDRAEYSPAWDLNVGVYSDAAVAGGQNGLQTDSDESAPSPPRRRSPRPAACLSARPTSSSTARRSRCWTSPSSGSPRSGWVHPAPARPRPADLDDDDSRRRGRRPFPCSVTAVALGPRSAATARPGCRQVPVRVLDG